MKRKEKALISSILISLLLFSISSMADAQKTSFYTYSLPAYALEQIFMDTQLCGRRGEVITFTISSGKIPNPVGELGFEVTYNPSILEYKAFGKGDLTPAFKKFEVTSPRSGKLRIDGTAASPIPSGKYGRIVMLTFTVKECQYSELTITNLTGDIAGWTASNGYLEPVTDPLYDRYAYTTTPINGYSYITPLVNAYGYTMPSISGYSYTTPPVNAYPYTMPSINGYPFIMPSFDELSFTIPPLGWPSSIGSASGSVTNFGTNYNSGDRYGNGYGYVSTTGGGFASAGGYNSGSGANSGAVYAGNSSNGLSNLSDQFSAMSAMFNSMLSFNSMLPFGILGSAGTVGGGLSGGGARSSSSVSGTATGGSTGNSSAGSASSASSGAGGATSSTSSGTAGVITSSSLSSFVGGGSLQEVDPKVVVGNTAGKMTIKVLFTNGTDFVKIGITQKAYRGGVAFSEQQQGNFTNANKVYQYTPVMLDIPSTSGGDNIVVKYMLDVYFPYFPYLPFNKNTSSANMLISLDELKKGITLVVTIDTKSPSKPVQIQKG